MSATAAITGVKMGVTMNGNDEHDPFTYPPPPPSAGPPVAFPPPGMGGAPMPPNFGPSMPPPLPYGYGPLAPAPMGSSQKNYLGILSLIFPFVFLGVVGIFMGHMGLLAVKKGKANNRGVALAGTIISWVSTVLVLPGILAAIAIPVYLNQQDKAHEAAVETELRTIAIEVETHFISDSEPPKVAIEGTNYVVGDTVEPKSSFVDDVDFVMTGDFT